MTYIIRITPWDDFKVNWEVFDRDSGERLSGGLMDKNHNAVDNFTGARYKELQLLGVPCDRAYKKVLEEVTLEDLVFLAREEAEKFVNRHKKYAFEYEYLAES